VNLGGGRPAAALAVLTALASLALSCGDSRPASQGRDSHAEARPLGGAAARVGGDEIPLTLVASVASAQRVAPAQAVRRLIDDAASAEGARTRGLDRAPPASWALTAARARLVAERLLADAKAAGPPTDAEIAQISEEHWVEVDRPVAVRTVHALAQRPKATDAASVAAARHLATALRAAVAGATDTADFMARAKAVPHPDLDVRVEEVPPATADGWVTEGPGKLDPVYSRAASALASPGDLTDVVETSFGWHVIRLVERIPERRMPLETRRVAFADEVYGVRARAARAAILEARTREIPIVVEPTAEELMRGVTVGPPAADRSP